MRTIKVELNEKDLEFIYTGLCCYMRRSLKNLKEESQEKVRTTLQKIEEARKEVKIMSKEKLKRMIYIRKCICPYCDFSSDILFPIEHYEGGSSGYRTFRCPSCRKIMEE